MKLKCQKSSELLNWTFSFWVRSRLCWQRIHERAEVKTLQMKKKTPKMQLLKGPEWTAQEWLRVYKRELQGRNKYNKTWGSNSPVCTTVLGLGWIPWSQRHGCSPTPGWPSPTGTDNGRNIYFLQYFAVFPLCLSFLLLLPLSWQQQRGGSGPQPQLREVGIFRELWKLNSDEPCPDLTDIKWQKGASQLLRPAEELLQKACGREIRGTGHKELVWGERGGKGQSIPCAAFPALLLHSAFPHSSKEAKKFSESLREPKEQDGLGRMCQDPAW